MSEKLSWIFEGVDRFTGPVGGMASSLVQFSFGLNQVTDLVGSLASGIEYLGSKTFDFAKFGVGALAFKENALAGFKTILGSDEAAVRMFETARKFAAVTPFETSDVITSFKKLAGAGFKEEEIPIVFQAIGDVSALNGMDKQVMDGITRALGQIKGKGHLMTQELNQVMENAQGAINRENLFATLAKNVGVPVDQVTGLIERGAVTSEVAIYSMIEAIKTQYGGLGKVQLAQGQTITGLLSNMASAGNDFFFAMGKRSIDSVQGMQTFKSALTNITDALSTMSPTGLKVMDALETAFGGIMTGFLGPLAGEKGAKGINKTLESLADWVKSVDWAGIFGTIRGVLVNTFEAVSGVMGGLTTALTPLTWMFGQFAKLLGASGTGDTLRIIGYALGFVFGAATVLAAGIAVLFFPVTAIIAAVIGLGAAIMALTEVDWSWDAITGGFTEMGHSISAWFKDMWPKFKEWGASIMWGLIEGITGISPEVWDSMTGTIGAGIDKVKGLLKSHSPSEVFADIGAGTVEGFVQGVDGNASDVQGAYGSFLPPSGGGRGTSPGGGGITVNLNFGEGSFPAMATEDMDPETFARRLAELLPSALAPVFENMAMQGGA
jgi:tape measure domain-containing protein